MSEPCPGCGQPNQCAVTQGKPPEQCWCMVTSVKQVFDDGKPKIVLPVPKTPASCYCEDCLAERKKGKLKRHFCEKN